MAVSEIPQPTMRPDRQIDVAALERDLSAEVDGEVRFDAGTKGAYSTDASNFRQVPIGVVIPHTVDAAVAAVAVCHRHQAPLLSRGGGTSLAGQCTNTAVVIDWSKYCNRLLSVDPQRRTCIVETGIVLDVLNEKLSEHGLRFGPEPATHPNCTLGGMIGNNSCGATAQRTGKVVDNLVALEVLLHDGTRFWCGRTSDEEYTDIERHGDRRAAIYRTLRQLRDEYADEIRDRYPDIPRRVSGYNLDSLLPEKEFHIGQLLVGSESTLVTVLRAELTLVPVIKKRSLVVLGFPNIATAADAVPAIVPHDPIALEGVDHRLIQDERIKHLNPDALAELPEGTGYLMVQFGGDTQDEADERARKLLEALHESEHEPDVALLDDPKHEEELWAVREAGLAATAHIPGRPDTFEGWEDSAVPPDRLGDYLRDLEKLYEEFGYASETGPSLYGHFGQGCVHTRIPFDLYSAEGVRKYRDFMHRAAELVASYGGSFSGEHGDGQSRGELLPLMFGDRIMEAFLSLKRLFDPENLMNPGKVIPADPLDDHLRLGGDWAPFTTEKLFFRYPEDGGSFVQAANRCVGVGKCRQHSHSGGQVMCPSYQVTGEEEHSTRGRARLLFEMLQGHPDGPVKDGWRSDAVKDALDLCLACKGCKTDCPANVDMATYKAEFLAHHYDKRIRPRSHYALGGLPVLAGAVTRAHLGPIVNAVVHAPGLKHLLPRIAGVEDRYVPLFAGETLQQWWSRRGPRGNGERGTVLLWPDTFTNTFSPHVGQAAVEVLEAAGWQVTIPTEPICCGLTLISTGQLAAARKTLRRALDLVGPHIRQGGLVLGLEPSCTAVFRSDAKELFPNDPDTDKLHDHTVTLAELLLEHTPGWTPPTLPQQRAALAQVHCHQHAIMGWSADEQLLKAIGVEPEHLESGCCGLAGNFGFEPGHKSVSEACAEQVLLPRIREASPQTLVLADGFSCRAQIDELDSNGRRGVHLAEVLAAATKQMTVPERTRPEDLFARRPQEPSTAAKVGVLAAAAAGLGLTARRLLRR